MGTQIENWHFWDRNNVNSLFSNLKRVEKLDILSVINDQRTFFCCAKCSHVWKQIFIAKTCFWNLTLQLLMYKFNTCLRRKTTKNGKNRHICHWIGLNQCCSKSILPFLQFSKSLKARKMRQVCLNVESSKWRFFENS